MTKEAEERLAEAEAEAAERTRGIEEEIAGLVRKRRDVVANLEQLDAEMRLAIEGPGEQDLGLPERVSDAVGYRPEEAADDGRRMRSSAPAGAGEPDTDERGEPRRRPSAVSPTPRSGSGAGGRSTPSIRRPTTRS